MKATARLAVLSIVCLVCIDHVTAATIADTVADFSLTQGTNNFTYGYETTPGNLATFTQYLPTENDGTQWKGPFAFCCGSGYPELFANGGHGITTTEGGGNGNAGPVRRYTSELLAPTTNTYISGTFGSLNTCCGSNNRVRVYVDGVERFNALTGTDGNIRGYGFYASLTPTSVVDWEIDPNGQFFGDATQLTATIQTAATDLRLLNLDFNGENSGRTFSGMGAIGTAGDVWNGVEVPNAPNQNTPTPATGFVATDGLPTTVALSLSGFNFADNAPETPSNDDLLEDYLGVVGTPGTATLSGLLPNTAYDLFLYGSNGRAGMGALFSVNGSTSQTASGDNPGGNPPPPFVFGVDYVVFNDILSNASGQLVITVGEEPNVGVGLFNGLQLIGPIPVPEPAALTSWYVAGSALLIYRSRRRRA